MASSKLLLFYLSPFLLHFLALSTMAQFHLLYHECYRDIGNYTANSPYEANLKLVLGSISTKSRVHNGFYSLSYGDQFPDRAYAVGICRPDMKPENCRNCINQVSKNLTSICPKSLLAIAGFEDAPARNYCMLRYANYDIFGLMENAPYFFVYNLNNVRENLVAKFRQTRLRLLKRLTGEVAGRGSRTFKYAAGEETVSGIYRIYALVQCNPDLSKADCNSCLNDTITLIPECCDTRIGGRVITPSCNFRYETGRFYDPIIEGPPLSPTN